MKANFYLIGISIVLLPLIWVINGKEHHWTEFIPLAYLVYGFIVGTWGFIKNRR